MRLDRWLGALGERDFRLYFAGRVTSFVGTGMLPVALSFAVLGRGGSIGDVGYVLGAETLPLVLLLLPAGVAADRYNRRALMVMADVGRAVPQGALAAWLLMGHPPLWGFLALEAAVGTGTAFFTPAMTGLIPEVSKPEHLHQANALSAMAMWSGTLVGPAIAGILVAASGPGWAVAVDGATYLVSAACLASLRVGWESRGSTERFVSQLRGGWRAFRERTWLWVVVTQFSTLGLLVFPPFFVLGAVVAKQSLGGAVAWGSILAAQGAGSLLGGATMLRVQPRRPLLVAEAVLLAWMLCLGALALRAPALVVGVGAFGAGLSFGVFGPLWDTTMQRELPPEVLSRASAYDWFGSFVFLPLGYVVVGFTARVLGVDGALWLAAAWIGASTLVVLCLPSVTGLRAPTSRRTVSGGWAGGRW
ncbi:MAG TPA: MFS transporter [Acidimicrobiales bacterium]|nr:MFS transporter [Acidimicrobiales bacterium]